MRYAYYPGCVARGACGELHLATTATAAALDIELIELQQAACCGSGTYKEDSQLLEDTVNARNIALAEALNLPLLTHCSTCQGTIGSVDRRLKTDLPQRDRVNQTLESQGCRPYAATTEVRHLLEVLVRDYGFERLAARVRRPLAGLKCASFYGCYLLRTEGGIGHFDDPHQPRSLEDLFQTLGATPVDYPGRTQCCGWPLASYATKASFTLAGTHIQAAIAAGADCLVTPCPLCHLNLDSRQPEVEAVIGQKLGLPVLHMSQLVALALGIDPQELGLDRHVVSAQSVVQKLAVAIPRG